MLSTIWSRLWRSTRSDYPATSTCKWTGPILVSSPAFRISAVRRRWSSGRWYASRPTITGISGAIWPSKWTSRGRSTSSSPKISWKSSRGYINLCFRSGRPKFSWNRFGSKFPGGSKRQGTTIWARVRRGSWQYLRGNCHRVGQGWTWWWTTYGPICRLMWLIRLGASWRRLSSILMTSKVVIE